MRVMMDFAGTEAVTKAYTDCAQELKSAVKQLGWLHPTATPHRPESRGKIEREIRTMVEGTRCNLQQAGLEHKRWPAAARHNVMATNFARVDPI